MWTEPDDDEADGDEEIAIELPPTDEDEPAVEDDTDLEDLIEPLRDDGDPLDDAVATDVEIGVDVGIDDGKRGDDEAAEGDVDVGPLDEGLVFDDGARWIGDDAEGALDPGEDIDDVGRGDEDDHGAEGTGEAPEDAIDEAALPALDADDEGVYEAEDLLAELAELGDDRPPGWDASPWTVIEGAGAPVPCVAVAIDSGRVVAVGGGRSRREPSETGGRGRVVGDRAGIAERGIALVVAAGELAAKRVALDAAAGSVALFDRAIVIATRRGQILRSDDGVTMGVLGAWRSGKGAPVSLAATPGRLWVLCAGALWSLPMDAAAAPIAVRDRGVTRVASSGGALVAVTSAPSGPQLERLRGDDEAAPGVALDGVAGQAAQAADGQLAASAGGQAVALSGEGALCVSRDGGKTFRAVGTLPPVLALAFAGESDSAPLLALVAREGESRAQIVRVPAHGAATIMAEIEGSPEPEATAIAWDAARELAWVACRAGLIALGRGRTH